MTKLLKAASAILLASAGLSLATPVLADQAAAGELQSENSRFSRSVEGRSARSVALKSDLQAAPVQGFSALQSEGQRVSPASARSASKQTSASQSKQKAGHDTTDFLIFDATSDVFYDLDGDGFYHGFAVAFDVDASEGTHDVYAELYLSRNGGPWNIYYTTQVFSIFGATADDMYEVVTELDVGYPSGDYDVLIEIYEADTGDFLADFGPLDDISLAYLPLEDAERDTPVVSGGGYYSYGGGGSTGPVLFALLMLLFARLQLRKDRRALTARGQAPRPPVQK